MHLPEKLPSHYYHFVTHWHVKAGAEEVYTILEDPAELVRWWPSVYFKVKEVKPHQVKKPSVFSLLTKGWLPYTLNWQFYTTEKIPYKTIALKATGDFKGVGVWSFRQQGAWTEVTYDWKVLADKPLLRYFSFLLKFLFAANHHWAMAQGERSLKLEIDRRHAKNLAERKSIPPPPPPSSTLLPLLMIGTTFTMLLGLCYYLLKYFFRHIPLNKQ